MENGNAIGGATVRFFNSGAEGFQVGDDVCYLP